MDKKIELPSRSEYSVTIENVTLRLLIDRTHIVASPTDTIMQTQMQTQHTHAYTELFVCGSGSISIRTGDSIIRLSAGDLALISAELPHHMLPTQDSGSWCALGILPVHRRIRGCHNLYRTLAELCCAPEVRIFRNRPEICQAALELSKMSAPNDTYLPSLEITRLLLKLAADDSKPATIDNAGPLTGGKVNRIAQLEHIIDVYFTEELTAEKIAAQLFISSSQLARIVSRRYGTTLHRVILLKRVNAAARLLVESDLSAEQIGLAVGFRSKSLFYRAFRRQHEMTPMEYREQHCRKEKQKRISSEL